MQPPRLLSPHRPPFPPLQRAKEGEELSPKIAILPNAHPSSTFPQPTTTPPHPLHPSDCSLHNAGMLHTGLLSALPDLHCQGLKRGEEFPPICTFSKCAPLLYHFPTQNHHHPYPMHPPGCSLHPTGMPHRGRLAKPLTSNARGRRGGEAVPPICTFSQMHTLPVRPPKPNTNPLYPMHPPQVCPTRDA